MTEPDDGGQRPARESSDEPRRPLLDPELAAAVAAALAPAAKPEPSAAPGPADPAPTPEADRTESDADRVPDAEPDAEPAALTDALPDAGSDVGPDALPDAGSGARPGGEPAGEELAGGVGRVVDLDVLTGVDEPEPEPVDTGESAEEELPALAGARLAAALEALLLVVDSPVPDDALAGALDVPVARVREALVRMAADYTEQERGIDLRPVGDGWRLFTRDVYAPYVEKLLLDGHRAKLTRAALETLAVIAYRQPVTRARVAAVRGVNVDGVIRTLLARGLIEETGTDGETGGILYRTTELFLERLGLSSLEDLPPIAPLLPEVDAIDDVF